MNYNNKNIKLIDNPNTDETLNNNGTAQTQNFIATPNHQPWQGSEIALRQFRANLVSIPPGKKSDPRWQRAGDGLAFLLPAEWGQGGDHHG